MASPTTDVYAGKWSWHPRIERELVGLHAVLPSRTQKRPRVVTAKNGFATLILLLAFGMLGVACTPGESKSSHSSTSQPPTRVPVKGLADFHSHEFAHLAFNSVLHSHDVDPLSKCRAPLTFDTSTLRVADLVREGLYKIAVGQAEHGQCFPTFTNLAGQQMDTDSLKRAWEYGLRLLVVHAVNSEFLCSVANLRGRCNDFLSIEDQVQAAKNLEAEIDSEAGGTGLGWYRIVYTPAEARDVIEDGKLAVVLGVEASNAFGCRVRGAGQVLGIPPIIVGPFTQFPVEMKWTVDCSLPVAGMATSLALARMEHYWDIGIRHFFPIHNIDGIAGGAALFSPLLHAMDNPSRLNPGGIFDRRPAINRVLTDIRPQFTSWDCSGGFDFDHGRCNAKGLTPSGVALVQLMASHGAIIDVDHMSYRAKGDLINAIGEYYPVVSSHTGVNAINHGDKSNEGQLTSSGDERRQVSSIIKWGGALAPILRGASSLSELDTFPPDAVAARQTCGGTTESFIQSYRYLAQQLTNTKLVTGGQAFVGLGFGSDFNGLAGWPAPRFIDPNPTHLDWRGGADIGETLQSAVIGDNVEPPPGLCYSVSSSEPRVQYPFTSPLTGKSFGRSVLPWSGRSEPYDISFDGVTHVGMIPDFVEEMRVLGLTDEELDPLWNGAEAYIRMWETAQGWAGGFNPEIRRDILGDCQALRSQLLIGSADPWFAPPETVDGWRAVMSQIHDLGCLGA
jgi:microsomal dipeptidase-like Zn-dependent dipeptidase